MRMPRVFDFGGQWHFITELIYRTGKQTLGGHKQTLCASEAHWNPPKKDTLYPREKEKSQQASRRQIVFRIKPYTYQRHSEGSNNLVHTREAETPQRLSQTCLYVYAEVGVSSETSRGTGLSGCMTCVM